MHLRNTSIHPTDEVQALIRFAAEPYDLRRVFVLVRDTKSAYRGLAYRNAPHQQKRLRIPASAQRMVMVAIGPASKFAAPVSNLRSTFRWVRITHEEYERLPPGIPTRGAMRSVDGVQEHWMEKSVAAVQPYGGKRSPFIWLHSWQEAMLAVAAHEFHHIDQYQRGVPPLERYCERAAAAVLERYRAKKEAGAATSPA